MNTNKRTLLAAAVAVAILAFGPLAATPAAAQAAGKSVV